jgi:hypothetical protein
VSFSSSQKRKCLYTFILKHLVASIIEYLTYRGAAEDISSVYQETGLTSKVTLKKWRTSL